MKATSSTRTTERQRSFYHLGETTIRDQPCQGLACFVARHVAPNWEAACSQRPPVYCLGKCYAAPACGTDTARPHIAIDAPSGIVLSRLAIGGARTLAAYMAMDGYSRLSDWLGRRPTDILDEVEASGLRGRGGAGFPAGKKWRAVAAQDAQPKYVIANADEGDPGAYIDRFLIEDDPHTLIEALILAGYAVGAQHGAVYLRKEYPEAQQILTQAIAEARDAGLLGENVSGTGFAFELEVFSGQGSYVCGEETALLNSMEGLPPMVRPRPPYPTQHGLFGKPTLVNNVETLANIPWILQHGGAAYHARGFSRSRGTKVLSLNSLFRRPGLYEVEFGVPIRHVLEDLGGGLRAGNNRGVIIGGPLAGILPPQHFDTPLGFEELQAVGASVGHGGVIAFDEHTSLPELIHHVFEFAAEESCGKCTPCRIGSRTVEEMFRRVLTKTPVSTDDKSWMTEIVSALHATSLCGLGTGLADFALSALKYYRDDVDSFLSASL
ncbi:MAG: SLBB domain-containing protein [Planctomycetales bacterium]|nr:SLBB domain-containing protein [Planctomycetales bacterium]